MRSWLDTNVLLRLATKSPPDLFERALALVEQAESGAFSLAIRPLRVAEVTYVLRSLYASTREEIRRELGIVLRLATLAVHDEENVLAALDLMVERNVDFDDTYLALWAAACGDGVASFDETTRSYRLPSSVRRVPSSSRRPGYRSKPACRYARCAIGSSHAAACGVNLRGHKRQEFVLNLLRGSASQRRSFRLQLADRTSGRSRSLVLGRFPAYWLCPVDRARPGRGLTTTRVVT